MKKEILKNYNITKINDTIRIRSKEFDFCYTKADDIVKDEYKGLYRYFGRLQCNYDKDSIEYKNLENWLCDIAESLLK